MYIDCSWMFGSYILWQMMMLNILFEREIPIKMNWIFFRTFALIVILKFDNYHVSIYLPYWLNFVFMTKSLLFFLLTILLALIFLQIKMMMKWIIKKITNYQNYKKILLWLPWNEKIKMYKIFRVCRKLLSKLPK